MKIYFAPMEGITDGIYRSVHHAVFGGPDKYFIPFVSPTASLGLTNREKRSLYYSSADEFPLVPQILTKESDSFIQTSKKLSDKGFTEVNLNLGCPSGTVTAKGKGSAMLKDTAFLKCFLDNVFSESDMPRVSAKTRIGFENPNEWPAIYETLAVYPFSEVIVHPRTRNEFYKGAAHKELLSQCEGGSSSIVYNGDIFTPEDAVKVLSDYPFVSAVMIGRGLIANPALALEINGIKKIDKASLYGFLTTLIDVYSSDRPFKATMGRMSEIMFYVTATLFNPKKPFKKLLKSGDTAELRDSLKRLFDECELKPQPYFEPFTPLSSFTDQ